MILYKKLLYSIPESKSFSFSLCCIGVKKRVGLSFAITIPKPECIHIQIQIDTQRVCRFSALYLHLTKLWIAWKSVLLYNFWLSSSEGFAVSLITNCRLWSQSIFMSLVRMIATQLKNPYENLVTVVFVASTSPYGFHMDTIWWDSRVFFSFF